MSQPHVIHRETGPGDTVVIPAAHITGDARRVREARAVATNGKAAQ